MHDNDDHNHPQHDHDNLVYDDDGWSQPHYHGRAEHFHIDNGPTIYAHDTGHINFSRTILDDVDNRRADATPVIGSGGYDITHRTPRPAPQHRPHS